jgi:hypothetical protein
VRNLAKLWCHANDGEYHPQPDDGQPIPPPGSGFVSVARPEAGNDHRDANRSGNLTRTECEFARASRQGKQDAHDCGEHDDAQIIARPNGFPLFMGIQAWVFCLAHLRLRCRFDRSTAN